MAGRTVSADAVKIGGGYGNVARTVCDSLRQADTFYPEETSGYPRFCEGARYWLQWAGFDASVYSPKNFTDDYKDDYMSRAHWVNALAGGSERMPDSAGCASRSTWPWPSTPMPGCATATRRSARWASSTPVSRAAASTAVPTATVRAT